MKVDGALVNKIRLEQDCSLQEALVIANTQIKAENKDLKIACIHKAETIKDIKTLLIQIILNEEN